MSIFPSRSPLYRRAGWLVICVVVVFVSVLPWLPAQVPRTKKNKGPRAVGLIQLAPNGKARLTPIAILIDGQFYDASEYKASPVPMALWTETVYEGEKTGVSAGLFTVTGALENEATKEWLAEGTWQPEGSMLAKPKKAASSIPRGLDDDSGPPVLRHNSAANPKPPEPSAAPVPATQAPASPAPSTGQSGSSAPTTPAPSSGSASTASNPASSPGGNSAASPQTPSPEQTEEGDKNRPVLKRGKPSVTPEEPLPEMKTAATPTKTTSPASPSTSASTSQVQLFPAISDASGPDPHSYAYILKPEETETYRKKMLALAADKIRGRDQQLASEMAGLQPARSQTRARSARQPAPTFEDVQMRVFDLSSSNEPILVLTARAAMPHATQTAAQDRQYMITLVARQDINGDFHTALANVTDDRHLDVLPQLQLIDAVDADGDGRGELLFRKVSDTSSAYVIYRVIGDQLYPLFEGAL